MHFACRSVTHRRLNPASCSVGCGPLASTRPTMIRGLKAIHETSWCISDKQLTSYAICRFVDGICVSITPLTPGFAHISQRLEASFTERTAAVCQQSAKPVVSISSLLDVASLSVVIIITAILSFRSPTNAGCAVETEWSLATSVISECRAVLVGESGRLDQFTKTADPLITSPDHLGIDLARQIHKFNLRHISLYNICRGLTLLVGRQEGHHTCKTRCFSNS